MTVQRWTGLVSAHESGGFVAVGDYLELQAEVAEFKVALEKEQALTAHHRTVQVELLSKVAELKAKLAEAEKRYPKSALETHPMIPNSKCKCEHWQRCEECTPTSLKGTP